MGRGGAGIVGGREKEGNSREKRSDGGDRRLKRGNEIGRMDRRKKDEYI